MEDELERQRRRAAATRLGPRPTTLVDDPIMTTIQTSDAVRSLVEADDVASQIRLNAAYSWEQLLANHLALIDLIARSGLRLDEADIEFLEKIAVVVKITTGQGIRLKNIYDRAVRLIHQDI